MAAAESLAIGYGGDAVVSSATGLARGTIRKGRREISRDEAPTDRIRRPGGGRPRIQQDQPGIPGRARSLGGSADARRPDLAAALDVQESREAGGGAERAGLAG